MADGRQDPAAPDEADLPPRLAAALRRLHDALPAIPPAVDNAILSDARQGFARRRRFRLAVRWAGGFAAAVAAVVVVAVNLYRGEPARDVATSGIRGDVDGNGRVDILDAFVLAKKLEATPARTTGGDVNGDGVVDRQDVDAVAVLAVRLPGGAQ